MRLRTGVHALALIALAMPALSVPPLSFASKRPPLVRPNTFVGAAAALARPAVPARARLVMGPSTATTSSDASRWRMLAQLCRQDAPLIAMSTLFMAAAAVAEASLPHFTSVALFAATSAGGGAVADAEVARAMRRLVCVGLAASVFTGLRGCAFWIAGARVLRRLRAQLFAALLGKPAWFFDANESAALSSRLSSDVGKISDVVSFNVNVIARQSIQALVTLAWLLRLNRHLSLLLVCGLLCTFGANQAYSAINRELSRKTQGEVARASAVATEGFRLIRTIKVYATEARETARYDRACGSIEALQEEQGRVYGSARALNGALAVGVAALVLWRGAALLRAGVLGAQQLTTFVLAAGTITSATIGIGEQWVKVQEALGAASEIFALIEQDESQPRADDELARAARQGAMASTATMPAAAVVAAAAPPLFPPAAAVAPAAVAAAAPLLSLLAAALATADSRAGATSLPAAALECDNVWFGYPQSGGRDVLSALSLRVPAGSLAAIVGASGSGKSTVMRLLCGLYTQRAGSVHVLGAEVSRTPRAQLAQSVAWLPQEPQLFAGSVRDNIAYGLEPGTFDDGDVLRAAALAHADGFIAELGGLDAQVGESGGRLSGGQRQRVAVARALMRGARVLLLDEPTSALDPSSERAVQDVVLSLVPQRTVLVVAHRISTVERADVIFVMADGRVVEEGTHVQLLARDGAYARLVRAGERASSLAA